MLSNRLAFGALAVACIGAAAGGGYLATVPDLPGCMSDGETPEEAARQAVENDWRAETRARREAEAYQALLDGYDVTIQRPR